MKNPNVRGDPFRQKKMQTYFKFSMIGFAAVLIVGMIALFSGGGVRIDYEQSNFVQYTAPSDDTPVVVFETTEGTFKAVLYEDEAPEYCRFFKDLVAEGYFNDTYICTILKTEGQSGGFIAGSKTADGANTEDTNTDMVNLEISPNMLPTRGSLGSLVKQGGRFSKAKAGSIFTVIDDVVDVEELRSLDNQDVNGFKRVCELFEKYGGVPNYLQMYTLFGQVYDGWDVIDKINSARIVGEELPDDDENKSFVPESEIKFTRVWLSTYGEQKQNGYTLPVLSEQTGTSSESENSSTAE